MSFIHTKSSYEWWEMNFKLNMRYFHVFLCIIDTFLHTYQWKISNLKIIDICVSSVFTCNVDIQISICSRMNDGISTICVCVCVRMYVYKNDCVKIKIITYRQVLNLYIFVEKKNIIESHKIYACVPNIFTSRASWHTNIHISPKV